VYSRNSGESSECITFVAQTCDPVIQLVLGERFRKAEEGRPQCASKVDLVRQSYPNILPQHMRLFLSHKKNHQTVCLELSPQRAELTGFCIRPLTYSVSQSSRSLHSESIAITPYLIL
jgi:hypothetical protein